MDDLIPKIMYGVGDIRKQWDIQPSQNGFVWIARVDDASLGIIDQYGKKHLYIFEKGAKIVQWFENKVLLMKYDGLKKIEYSND